MFMPCGWQDEQSTQGLPRRKLHKITAELHNMASMHANDNGLPSLRPLFSIIIWTWSEAPRAARSSPGYLLALSSSPATDDPKFPNSD